MAETRNTPAFLVYSPGEDNDVGLLQWYAHVAAADDLRKMLGPSLWPMAAFMTHFTAPGLTLYYLPDGNGWAAVAWTVPFIAGAAWGLWVRPTVRSTGSRRVIRFIMGCLKDALQRYPVLVNITKRPEIVKKTERLGYTHVGKIPALFEGEDCYIMYLTAADFEPLWERWTAYGWSSR